MNSKSKKKREERVRRQKLLQSEQRMKDNKEQAVRDRLQYLTRQRQTPIVRPEDSVLERNLKMLESAIAEHQTLIDFREENKETNGKVE